MGDKAIEKKADVPLDEALTIAGTGRYTYFVVFTSGLIGMSALMTTQTMSIVMPVTGCELQLSDAARGIIASMPFTGMLFSAQLFGFFADTFGRKKVMIYCFMSILLVILFLCMVPDATSLGVLVFLKGFILTGIFTPVYVFVGEYSEPTFRAKAFIIMSGLIGMSYFLMPSLAWIILPLDVYIPISELIVFTPWRLFILLLLVPNFLSLALLLKIPDTPKFLLIQGRNKETLQVMKKIYAINNKKNEEDFPVANIVLDEGDIPCDKDEKGNRFFNYLKMMATQILILFSRKNVVFTLISCALLFGTVGTSNSAFLWFPEMTSRITNYSHSKGNFNATLCDLMGLINTGRDSSCGFSYDFLSASILLGITYFTACQFLGIIVQKLNKKIFIASCIFLSSGFSFAIPFIREEYIIMLLLGAFIIALFLIFSVILSIVVEFFPTQLRSTATSITMTCARLGSALGSQALGLLFPNYCNIAFYGITSTLVVCGVLSILLQTRKKSC